MNIHRIYQAVKATSIAAFIVSPLLTWNVNSAQAGLDLQAIDRVKSLSLIVKNDTAKVRENNTDLASNYNRARSIQYQEIGIEAQKIGDYEAALFNYKNAIQFDRENGHAWFLVGTLLGNTKLGIESLTVAAALFKAQEDDECYRRAIDLLQKFGAID
jgi:tetratricopeptide (TPR) repeat protein